MLSKKSILAADDIPTETLEIPEWGGEVVVRGFNAGERASIAEMYSQAQKDGKLQPDSIGARVAIMCVLDGDEPMFSEDDIAALESKSSAALDRITLKVQELSGLGDSDFEEAVKN